MWVCGLEETSEVVGRETALSAGHVSEQGD